ncbi:MAG: hypothetical protein ACLTCB_01125 [Merdibacter sp.]
MEKSERLLEEEYSTYEAPWKKCALAADLLGRAAGGQAACVWSVVCPAR